MIWSLDLKLWVSLVSSCGVKIFSNAPIWLVGVWGGLWGAGGVFRTIWAVVSSLCCFFVSQIPIISCSVLLGWASFSVYSLTLALEQFMSKNHGVAHSAEESAPAFLMYSPGAELNWGGRVTLVLCRGCQRDYGNSYPPSSIPPHSQLFLGDTKLTSPTIPPSVALLITTPRMMNISTIVLPNWR